VTGLRGRWTARFAPGAPAEALAAAGFASRGAERWSISADGPGPLNAALDRARAAGGLLLELTPEGQDLEAALVQAMALGSGPLRGRHAAPPRRRFGLELEVVGGALAASRLFGGVMGRTIQAADVALRPLFEFVAFTVF
jgi:hypothetical protein